MCWDFDTSRSKWSTLLIWCVRLFQTSQIIGHAPLLPAVLEPPLSLQSCIVLTFFNSVHSLSICSSSMSRHVMLWSSPSKEISFTWSFMCPGLELLAVLRLHKHVFWSDNSAKLGIGSDVIDHNTHIEGLNYESRCPRASFFLRL